jgi:arsenite-transporting ATPase
MRILVFTGKGGVGKTSVAAATALRCADLGYRTLVVSTDTAHSLGDSLQAELGPEPINITNNLDAQEIDVHYSIQKYWGELQKMAVNMFTEHGVEDVIAEEVAILPGLEEGASLLWLAEFAEQDRYDVVVIDAAPTAETLRLLTLPDALRWWIDKMMPMGRTAAKLLGPLARPLGINPPDAATVDAVKRLFDSLDEVRHMLANAETASMRLVVNAERMVIKETQRTYTYLNLYGYPVDAVVCNRLIPADVTDPHFKAWKESQAEHLNLIHECFDPLPLFTSPLFPREMGGLDMLRQLSKSLYNEEDPAKHFYEGQPTQVESDGEGGYLMRLSLPLTDKSQIDLYRATDELTLSVGAYRRNIALPRLLWPLEVQSAKLNEGILTLHFVQSET